MKHKGISKFFWKTQKKKDFFTEFWGEFLHIVKDIFLLFRNFYHWTVSKIIINIVALWVGLVLALPFFLFAVFIALIDPIPWGTLIVYQLQWINSLLEVLSYATLHTFSFVVMTLVMIVTLLFFLIWNAYSNVLLIRLYRWYLEKEKYDFKKNLYLSAPHIKKFVFVALWHGLILLTPLLLLWSIALVFIALQWGGKITFEVFSLSLLILVLVSIFILSYTLYRILFSVIYLAFDKKEKVEKHSWWHYIKKSMKVTSWVKKYAKFMFVLAFLFLITHPLRLAGENIQNDISRLSSAIEYRALALANPEVAPESPLRETALYYEELSDEKLFANYRGAVLLSILLSVIGFLLFSGLYTMAFVSFYTRILS